MECSFSGITDCNMKP